MKKKYKNIFCLKYQFYRRLSSPGKFQGLYGSVVVVENVSDRLKNSIKKNIYIYIYKSIYIKVEKNWQAQAGTKKLERLLVPRLRDDLVCSPGNTTGIKDFLLLVY